MELNRNPFLVRQILSCQVKIKKFHNGSMLTFPLKLLEGTLLGTWPCVPVRVVSLHEYFGAVRRGISCHTVRISPKQKNSHLKFPALLFNKYCVTIFYFANLRFLMLIISLWDDQPSSRYEMINPKFWPFPFDRFLR